MKNILKFINTVSLILALVWGVTGVICEIIGPVRFEKLLMWIDPSLSFEIFANTGYVILLILVVSYYLRSRCEKR